MTEVSKLAEQLYVAMGYESERLCRIDTRGMFRDSWQLLAAVRDAKAGVLAVDFPRWLGRPLDVADRKACSRALAELERAERFIRFHNIRHPITMAEPEVNAFLTHLAVERNVAASTQNQAMAALLFLYAHVLGRPLNRLDVVRANRPARLPAVLSRDEVGRVLAGLSGVPGLVCRLQYGAGLRLLEALQLRVKDIDFEGPRLVVRDGKGFQDRVTVLPTVLAPTLRATWRPAADSTTPTWPAAVGGSAARRAGAEVPGRGGGVGVAVGVPSLVALHRRADRGAAPAPPSRDAVRQGAAGGGGRAGAG